MPKGPEETRNIVSWWRRKHKKRNHHKNGEIGWVDSPYFERLYYNSKKNYKRLKKVDMAESSD